jgi:O-antigen ligase
MTELLHPARVLRLAAVLVPPLAVIAPRGLAVVLPLTALAAAVGAWRKAAFRPPPAVPTAIIVALLCWGAASALWAIELRPVWSTWPQIAALAACGLALLGVARGLDDEARNPIGLALAFGIGLALALLLIEWASGRLFGQSLGAFLYKQFSQRPFHTYVFNRAAATLALMVWPAALAVHRRFGWPRATLLVVATLLIVSRFDSMASIVGLCGGLAVWLVLSWPPRAMAYGVAAVLAIAIGLSPLVLPDKPAERGVRVEAPASDLPPLEGSVSVTHRLKIWRFVADAIADRPLTGWGLNASRELPGGNVEVGPGATRLPLHPHNAFLQVWVELGAVGAALAAALGIIALRAVLTLRLPAAADARGARASALALIASGSLVAGVAFGIWQGWWMAALWLAAGFMAAIGGPAQRDRAAARSP